MMTTEDYYWAGLSAMEGVGPVNFRKLLEKFGSAEAVWNGDKREMREKGVGGKFIERFWEYKNRFNLEDFINRLNKIGINFITSRSSDYPRLLLEIEDCPPVLYYKTGSGRFSKGIWEKTLAVVGTRKISAYGRQIAKDLVSDLVSAGITIVSGLMYGVDETAHRAALNSGGATVGVWAGGIDTLWQSSRRGLTEEMLKGDKRGNGDKGDEEEDGEKGGGGNIIVSEFSPGMEPTAGTFPARNRIVSGLSLGVLVIEAAEDSGSLITAGYAAGQGREVFAVPGPITSEVSAGALNLLKKGAKLVTSAQDILEELGFGGGKGDKGDKRNRGNIKGETEEENKIIEILKRGGVEIDDLARLVGWDAGKVTGVLSVMEIRGVVFNENGVYYIK